MMITFETYKSSTWWISNLFFIRKPKIKYEVGIDSCLGYIASVRYSEKGVGVW